MVTNRCAEGVLVETTGWEGKGGQVAGLGDWVLEPGGLGGLKSFGR